MPELSFTFAAHDAKSDFPDLPKGPLVVFATSADSLAGTAAQIDSAGDGALSAGAKASGFKAGWGETVSLYAVPSAPVDQVVLTGANPDKAKDPEPHLMFGGKLASALSKASAATIVFDDMAADEAASVLAGLRLGAYRFDRYKSRPEKDDDNGDEETPPQSLAVTVLASDPSALEAAFQQADAIASGTILARDLVNEPPNVLGPVEFAGVAEALDELGIGVTVLDDAAMEDLGMGALLGVAQGSEKPARLAIMEWKGGSNDKPVAVVGKGVVFDTGGISIKPSAGMEDMKGDMGGAACVGIHAYAGRPQSQGKCCRRHRAG